MLKPQELDQVRETAVNYYLRSSKPESDNFIEELKRGQSVANEAECRIGIWHVEDREGQLALVRHPPVSQFMRYVGLFLQQVPRGWQVTEEFEEIEKLDL